MFGNVKCRQRDNGGRSVIMCLMVHGYISCIQVICFHFGIHQFGDVSLLSLQEVKLALCVTMVTSCRTASCVKMEVSFLHAVVSGIEINKLMGAGRRNVWGITIGRSVCAVPGC